MLIILLSLLITQPQGQIIWSAQGTGGIYCAIPTYDYNNDGHPDVVAGAYYGAYPSPPIRLFLRSGIDGSLIWSRSDCQGLYGSRGLSTISDISGDSIPDIVFGTPGGVFPGRTVFAINGLTSSTIWSYCFYPNAGWVYSVRPTIDINHDGYPEVLASVGTISTDPRGVAACFSGYSGELLWSFRPNDAGMCIAPHIDLNNDTVPEVILAVGGNGYERAIYCLNGRFGTPVWSYQAPGSNLGFEYVISFDDINNNGINDVVGGGWDYTVSCVEGSTGNLIWANNLGSGRVIYELRRIRDINGDGKDDIVVGSWSSLVTVLSGLNGTVLWSQSVGSDCWNIDTMPDLTNDGISEIVVGALNGRIVKVLNGTNGDVIWQYSFADRIYDVACADDLDGDGYADVLVSLQDQQSQPYHLYAFKGYFVGIEENTQHQILPKIKVRQQRQSVAIELNITKNRKFQYQLFDINGRMVFSSPLKTSIQEINVITINRTNLTSGIYFLKIAIEQQPAVTVKITLF
ncbi:MAG: PQQ-binding-like beta-propeller repeat protein [candidate division WOR-3 bacterium]